MKPSIKKLILPLALTLGLSSTAVAQQKPAAEQPSQSPKTAQTQSGVATNWKQIAIPPLAEFKPAQPVRIALPNGMVIFLQEDHELPLIRGSASIRGGSRNEPAEKAGLAELLGRTWRTGGTEAQTGDQLDDFLEARAAKLETGAGSETLSMSFDCLKADFPEVFKLFVELLEHPAFREEKLKLEQGQMKGEISRRNDDSDSILYREAAYLAYGRENPYARTPEYYTVDAVTRRDLIDFHKRYVHPNNIVLGISGDFDAKQVETLLRESFGKWEKGPAPEVRKFAATPANPGIYLAGKEDVNQSGILLTEPGIRRDNPDYIATQVLNEIIGGGFASRLFSNLRTKRGLAYSVYGNIGARYDHEGLTTLFIGTKSETTAEAIKGLNEEIGKLLGSEPATEEELKRAKDSLLNSFVFHFDSPDKVLGERMTYEIYGYPADFLTRFRAGVEKTTLEDVQRAAARYLKPGQFITLVVGKGSEIEKQLEPLGPVTKLDIEIPTESPAAKRAREAAEKAAPKPAAAVTTPEAKALLAKVAENQGGLEHIRQLKSTLTKGTLTVNSPQGEMIFQMADYTILPDREAVTLSAPMGEMRVVVTPESAFETVGPKSADMPPEEKAEMLEELSHNPLLIVQHAGDAAYGFAVKGEETIDGVAAKILAITLQGKTFTWFIDPATGRILRADTTLSRQGKTIARSTLLSGYKLLSGIDTATRIVVKEDGEISQTLEVSSQEYDVAADPALFAKPGEKAKP